MDLFSTAEYGDDGAEVLGGDGAGAAVKVVGMVVLPLGIDDGDAAGLAHGASAGKGEGHDGETGERLVVGVVDFDGVHSLRLLLQRLVCIVTDFAGLVELLFHGGVLVGKLANGEIVDLVVGKAEVVV